MTLTTEVTWLVGVGFVAQLIDGCVGMGYGISASAILATLGVAPAVTSASVHAAEVVIAGVSSASHSWFRNIDRRIAIGTANAAIFFVALGTCLTLWVPLGGLRYDRVIALLIGGALAAPLAAYLTRHVPQRVAAAAVGLGVLMLGAGGR